MNFSLFCHGYLLVLHPTRSVSLHHESVWLRFDLDFQNVTLPETNINGWKMKFSFRECRFLRG